MYAIIETGGKQYKVEEGDELDVELLKDSEGKAAEGSFKFEKVLMVHDGKAATIGQPHLTKCEVHADVMGEEKGPKVIAFKYKKGNYRRTVGHRQKYTRVKIKKIVAAAA